MKKLLLLALTFSLAVTSCSTDSAIEDAAINKALTERGSAVQTSTIEIGAPLNPILVNPGPSPCFNNITAEYDNIGTLSNPLWNFSVNIAEAVPAGNSYKVVLEIQATDGEDITVGIGEIISITDNVTYTNISATAPAIARTPGQLLQWYRWRIRVYGLNGRNNNVNCEQVTPWYDNPLG